MAVFLDFMVGRLAALAAYCPPGSSALNRQSPAAAWGVHVPLSAAVPLLGCLPWISFAAGGSVGIMGIRSAAVSFHHVCGRSKLLLAASVLALGPLFLAAQAVRLEHGGRPPDPCVRWFARIWGASIQRLQWFQSAAVVAIVYQVSPATIFIVL